MSELDRVDRSGAAGSDGHRDLQGPITAADIPGLAAVAAVSSFRIGAWTVATGLHAGRRAVDVALHPEHAGELVEELRGALSAMSRAVTGGSVDRQVRHVATSSPVVGPVVRVVADVVDTVSPPAHRPAGEPATENPLHQAGQELLRRSRDVWAEDRGHPAYARIIEELAPDEGRILMLLLRRGPQPTLDVRTGGMVGTVSSTLVKANLNMIGSLSGCRYLDRVPSYLHNLERLGLIWFSREAVRDPEEYQVLEAQPDVLAARASVRRSKVVRRSIHLTPFGEDFCREGLGLHLTLDELDAVPPHRKPTED